MYFFRPSKTTIFGNEIDSPKALASKRKYMLKKKMKNKLTTLTLAFGIAACSSGPKIQEFPDTANAAEELQKLSSDMQSALAAQTNVLAPTAYGEAEEALDAAREAQKDGKNSKKVLHNVARGRAQLDRANRFSETSRSNLEEVAAARQAAMLVEANKLFREDFNEADEDLRSMSSEIEDNNLENVAKNREKLQKGYLDVELKAIKFQNLGAARSTISLAIKEGAKEFAQQSLAIAEKAADNAEAFIVANRHQNDALKERSKIATLAADHLLKITRASKAGKNTTPEQAALILEKQKMETEDSQAALGDARDSAKDIALKTSDLRADQSFNNSFKVARAEFTDREAEVYRKGDKLVIRLRSLQFPVNTSVIKGSNFPLLAKVSKVVKGFDNPTVVVEGYTDSMGGKALNKKLSTARSEAISTYLVANDAIAQGSITSIGHGSERPLASNKTQQGRAQNRRVDIVISPTM